MELVERTEDLIVERLFYSLPESELKELDSASRLIDALDRDSIDEIKQEIFEMVLRRLNYRFVIDRLQERLSDTESTDVSDNEEEENHEE
jgi:hypothetical protein